MLIYISKPIYLPGSPWAPGGPERPVFPTPGGPGGPLRSATMSSICSETCGETDLLSKRVVWHFKRQLFVTSYVLG